MKCSKNFLLNVPVMNILVNSWGVKTSQTLWYTPTGIAEDKVEVSAHFCVVGCIITYKNYQHDKIWIQNIILLGNMMYRLSESCIRKTNYILSIRLREADDNFRREISSILIFSWFSCHYVCYQFYYFQRSAYFLHSNHKKSYLSWTSKRWLCAGISL